MTDMVCTMKELIGCSINNISLGSITNGQQYGDEYTVVRFGTEKGNFYYEVYWEAYGEGAFSKLNGVSNLLSHKVIETTMAAKDAGIDITTTAGKAHIGFWSNAYYETWVDVAKNIQDRKLFWKDIVKDWKS